MNTEQRIFTLLNKVSEIKKTKISKFSKLQEAVKSDSSFSTKLAELKKAKKPIVAKKPRIKLGKVDELEYDYSTVEDEVSRVSYFVDEYFDELFEQAQTSWMALNDIFKFDSESFWRFEDLVGDDKVRLDEIKDLADQLGIEVEEVYPDWQEHYDVIERGLKLDSEFDDKEREFNNYFG